MSDEPRDAPAPDPLETQAETLFKEMDPTKRESGLRLDRDGRWHHQGVPVTHERLHRALTRWLTRDPGAERFVIRVGPDFWAWVDVDDAPYQAHLQTVTDQGLVLSLSDERLVVWSGTAIGVGADDAWYVEVGDPPMEARLSRGAMSTLAEYLEEDPDDEDAVRLALPGGRFVGFRTRPG